MSAIAIVCVAVFFFVLGMITGRLIFKKRIVSGRLIVLEDEDTLVTYLEIENAETINQLRTGEVVSFSVRRKP